MSRVALDQLVQTPEGRLTTINQLDREGKIVFEKSDNFMGRGGKITKKFFATIKGTSSCWEISEVAYLSRTGQEVVLT